MTSPHHRVGGLNPPYSIESEEKIDCVHTYIFDIMKHISQYRGELAMLKLFFKAQDLEEKDSFQIFNHSGKPAYYTKDDFIATGHRIKLFMNETITEVAYVQEKQVRNKTKFEFCARGDFGTVERTRDFTGRPSYAVDYSNKWLVAGDGLNWNYTVKMGSLNIMKVEKMPYLIPGQALNITDTVVITVFNDSDALISLAFCLAVYALNRYSYNY